MYNSMITKQSIKNFKVNDKMMFCRGVAGLDWTKNSFILGKVTECTKDTFAILYENRLSKTVFDAKNEIIDVYSGQLSKIN